MRLERYVKQIGKNAWVVTETIVGVGSWTYPTFTKPEEQQ